MSYRKTFKLLCGVAGGSAVILVAASAADSRGYFGERRGAAACQRTRLSVSAAQPAWTPASHTPAPTGHSWDFNWDKYEPPRAFSVGLSEFSSHCHCFISFYR